MTVDCPEIGTWAIGKRRLWPWSHPRDGGGCQSNQKCRDKIVKAPSITSQRVWKAARQRVQDTLVLAHGHALQKPFLLTEHEPPATPEPQA